MEATLYVSGFMVFGSLNTLFTKLQFSLSSVGLDGQEKEFSKPWFGSYRMFTAMSLVLLGYLVSTLFLFLSRAGSSSSRLKPDARSAENLLAAGQQAQAAAFSIWQLDFKTVASIAVPACCDLLASSSSFVGLLYINASVWQMLRGSMVVFSAILSVIFLKRKMFAFNWAGVFLCVCGILLVGSANMLAQSQSNSNSSAGNTNSETTQDIRTQDLQEDQANQLIGGELFGMSLVILGQLIQAGQVVVEEKILKPAPTDDPKPELPAAVVVGLEGLWGFAILTVIGFPLLYALPGSDYGGSQENLIDSLTMIKNSAPLATVIGIYLLSCSLYNFCGMSITRFLNAVHRTMLDAWRTMVIWMVGLGYHQFVDAESDFGEAWTPYSWIQLVGFIVLILGQVVYGGLLKLPMLFEYPDLEDKGLKMEDMISPASTLHCVISPLPMLDSQDGGNNSRNNSTLDIVNALEGGNNMQKKQQLTEHLMGKKKGGCCGKC